MGLQSVFTAFPDQQQCSSMPVCSGGAETGCPITAGWCLMVCLVQCQGSHSRQVVKDTAPSAHLIIGFSHVAKVVQQRPALHCPQPGALHLLNLLAQSLLLLLCSWELLCSSCYCHQPQREVAVPHRPELVEWGHQTLTASLPRHLLQLLLTDV